ncbi:PNK3P-domain-containing protein [Aureobasidium pullulans]|uniref:PNK3P-domain-containing protein n=1 Tax=Aureobasidium pullulans TaxID=5580 RepID=A0A4S9ENK9_AURPU|nr:PNK3P-domain-containing protein [Aureobasidium pullulans]TIA41042.1 PNK3P-domain-containing protein [Aureobasidium pullulans]
MPPGLKRLATEDGSVSPPPLKRTAPAASTTTNSAVANFFKPASQKEPEKLTWKVIDNTLLYCKYDKVDGSAAVRPRKIAAFDFDSTLVDAKSGNRFARDGDDWKWWHRQVPSKLKQLAEDGYLLAILSNQAGISMKSDSKTVKSDKKRLVDFKQRVKGVLTQLDLPIVLYAATDKDKFRKPRSGMWDKLLEAQGLTQEGDVDLQACYFVGDAGGRTASTGGFKADFSCSDRDLASNIGINFMTPEEFFLDDEPRPFARAFDPSKHVSPVLTSKTDASPIAFTRKDDPELVIFCGSPGAGKSTWFQQHLKPLGYERVNQDLLKSRDRCLKVAREFLEDGKSVAVDNTNADLKAREYWTSLAKSLEIPIRCVHFTAPAKLCEHNDAYRAIGGLLHGMNPESRIMLPRQAFTGFAGRYVPPTLDEGFVDITKVEFEFSGTEEQKTAWSKFWV